MRYSKEPQTNQGEGESYGGTVGPENNAQSLHCLYRRDYSDVFFRLKPNSVSMLGDIYQDQKVNGTKEKESSWNTPSTLMQAHGYTDHLLRPHREH